MEGKKQWRATDPTNVNHFDVNPMWGHLMIKSIFWGAKFCIGRNMLSMDKNGTAIDAVNPGGQQLQPYAVSPDNKWIVGMSGGRDSEG